MDKPNQEQTVRLLPVRLNNSDGEQIIDQLTIKFGFDQSEDHGQILMVQITSENDPFLLYEMHLTLSEFQVLSKKQSLTVKFQDFPYLLAELIEARSKPIINSMTNNFDNMSLISNAESKFVSQSHHVTYAQLLTNTPGSPEAILKFVELNGFRENTELSLCCRRASDAAIRDYLAKCLNEFKGLSKSLSNKYSDTEVQNELMLQENSRLQRDIQLLKSEHEQVLNSLQLEHERKFLSFESEMNSKNLDTQSSLAKLHQNEKKDILLQLEVETLKKEQLKLDFEVLSQKYKLLEETDKINVQALSNEMSRSARLDSEAGDLRSKNLSLSDCLRSAETTIAELNVKLQVAVESQHHLKQRLDQSEQLSVSSSEHLRQCEENLQHTKSLYDTEKQKSTKFASEIHNMDIAWKKSRAENATLRSEIKNIKKDSSNREKVHQVIENTLKAAQSRVLELEQEVSRTQLMLDDTKKLYLQLQEKHSEAERVLTSNANLILFLKDQAKPSAALLDCQNNLSYSSMLPNNNNNPHYSAPPTSFALDRTPQMRGSSSNNNSHTSLNNNVNSAANNSHSRNINVFAPSTPKYSHNTVAAPSGSATTAASGGGVPAPIGIDFTSRTPRASPVASSSFYHNYVENNNHIPANAINNDSNRYRGLDMNIKTLASSISSTLNTFNTSSEQTLSNITDIPSAPPPNVMALIHKYAIPFGS